MSVGFQSQRVLYSDNGVVTDRTISMNDFRSRTMLLPAIAGEDHLYVGTDLPFNALYFDVVTANTLPSNITIEVWTGTAWETALDILDYTASDAGASLSESGHVVFNLEKNSCNWAKECDSKDVDGLAGTRVQNMYWMRYSWDADLSAPTELNYIGYKFSDDSDLFCHYPDLNNSQFLCAFDKDPGDASDKADWDEQSFAAAQAIIMDLRRRGIVCSEKQIMDHKLYTEASIHKTAAIIFAGLGGSQVDEYQRALLRYDAAMDLKNYGIDTNANGSLDDCEKCVSTTWGSR